MPKHIFKISVDTGSDTIAGSVKLSDALDSELNVTDGTASTPYATKQINDLLVAHTVVSKKEIGAIGSPTVYGHVRLNDVINRTDLGYSTGYAASVGAVSKVNEKVEGLITSKLDTSGGTIDGNLTVTGDITVEGIINASISGTSESATNAEYAFKDADGNTITSTYATKEELANIDVTSKLHIVATSGSYTDLINTPSIYTSEELDIKLADKVNTTDILEDGIIKSSILPSYIDDVIEVDTYDTLPTNGESGKIYITLDTNKSYRWSGTTYIAIASALELGNTSGTAYEGSAGKQLEDNLNILHNNVSLLETNIPNTYSTKEEVSNLQTSIDTSITNINNTLDQLTAGQIITTVISLDDTDIVPVDRSTIFTKTITTDTTLAFEVPSTQYSEFWLYVVDGGSYNVIFPDNVKWNHSFEPILSVGTTDILRFVTLNTGTTWLATQVDSDL